MAASCIEMLWGVQSAKARGACRQSSHVPQKIFEACIGASQPGREPGRAARIILNQKNLPTTLGAEYVIRLVHAVVLCRSVSLADSVPKHTSSRDPFIGPVLPQHQRPFRLERAQYVRPPPPVLPSSWSRRACGAPHVAAQTPFPPPPRRPALPCHFAATHALPSLEGRIEAHAGGIQRWTVRSSARPPDTAQRALPTPPGQPRNRSSTHGPVPTACGAGA